jgi:2-polyprenyl-3-methyl-5-hydroxy-6-metoxy-1,4-benzoquinol methylase
MSRMERPFRTAAPHYARYRPAYPAELVARLTRATQVDRSSRVLDLGCGPGSLSLPLAAYAGEVVAVDAEPEMLVELRRIAPSNVIAIQARAEDVDESWGAFRLVTAGRAFHWFDAQHVLGRLAALTPALALVADEIGTSEAQMRTLRIAAELIEDPRIRRPAFRYTDILGSSAFSEVEVISVEVERTWTPDELIGMAYSTSAASPERLGARMVEFERRVRQELEPSYRERVSVDAVIGRRPRGSSAVSG